MDRGRLRPGDARVSLHLRLNSMLQLLLDSGKLGPQLLRQFDGKKRPDHFKPALFMTVRREIAEPRRETGARSLEDWLAVCGGACPAPERGQAPMKGVSPRQYGEGPRGEPAGRRLVVAADRRLQQKCS